VLEELARLGQFAGMQGQLLDDARDASPSAPGTSDIRLRKKTLPVAFFLQREDRVPEHDTLRRLYTTASALDAETEMAMRRAVEASGGLEVTTVLAGWYKMRAAEVLERLHKRGCDTSLLRAHLQMEDQAAAPPGAPSPA
jgi:geranylgeranyl pyrophosphate synthase